MRSAVDLNADIAWHLVEGPPLRDLEFDGDTKTVVMASPNHSNFHTFIQGRYGLRELSFAGLNL
jgi:hypothetical protein